MRFKRLWRLNHDLKITHIVEYIFGQMRNGIINICYYHIAALSIGNSTLKFTS